MHRTVFSMALLVAISHTCAPAIVLQTAKPEVLSRLYEATIDLLRACYGEPRSSAVAIVGDSDGSILETVWSNDFIPAVLIDIRMRMHKSVTVRNLHKLRVFVIAANSPKRFLSLMTELENTIWWDNEAHFLILDPTPDAENQCSKPVNLYIAFAKFGVLNAQVVCVDHAMNAWVFNFNPFTSRAPGSWEFVRTYKTVGRPFSIFKQIYRCGGETCENLQFEKTTDIDGYPFFLVSRSVWLVQQFTRNLRKSPPKAGSHLLRWIDYLLVRESRFVVDNIATGLNATTVVKRDFNNISVSMTLDPWWMSAAVPQVNINKLYPQVEYSLIAVTQHTGHMTQLEKILSVTDRPCRIGMCIVYLITFLFFKFFMHLSVTPAILNLVRLTANSGLPKLPENLASTIYLACLFMFVVTFQGVYTGNLASLITTTIPYPRVNTKQDISNLKYTVYAQPNVYNILIEDSVIDGPIIEIPYEEECSDFVMADPLVTCVLDYYKAVSAACYRKLHLSKEAISRDYTLHLLTPNNPFASRLETIMRRWDEYGLRPNNEILTIFQRELVDDDIVKNNTERRVMHFDDLSFAFVMLGIGLACAIVCFIGEMIFYRIRMKIAKRRKGPRRLLVGEAKKKSSIRPA